MYTSGFCIHPDSDLEPGKGRAIMATEKYQALRAVLETGSFSQAAVKLGYAQSSISRMVADLEKDWGVRVLNRSRDGITLTDEGERIVPAMLRLCAVDDDLTACVADVNGLATGMLRIGAISSVATHWISRMIAAFHDDYPGVTCELLMGNYTEIETWIRDGRVDCGFVRLPAATGLELIPVADDPLYAILPKNHPLTVKNTVSAADLVAYPFIELRENDDVEDAGIFDGLANRPEPVVSTWDDYCVMAMVEKGVGVSVLPGLIQERTSYEIERRPLNPPAVRHLAFAKRGDGYTPLAVHRFEEYLDLIP
jgi:DNA-binding transcriptional LysR family regulator